MEQTKTAFHVFGFCEGRDAQSSKMPTVNLFMVLGKQVVEDEEMISN